MVWRGGEYRERQLFPHHVVAGFIRTGWHNLSDKGSTRQFQWDATQPAVAHGDEYANSLTYNSSPQQKQLSSTGIVNERAREQGRSHIFLIIIWRMRVKLVLRTCRMMGCETVRRTGTSTNTNGELMPACTALHLDLECFSRCSEMMYHICCCCCWGYICRAISKDFLKLPEPAIILVAPQTAHNSQLSGRKRRIGNGAFLLCSPFNGRRWKKQRNAWSTCFPDCTSIHSDFNADSRAELQTNVM